MPVVRKCSAITSAREIVRRSGSGVTTFVYGETASAGSSADGSPVRRTWSRSASETPGGGETTLRLPVAIADSSRVCGKLPCTSWSWLPNAVYQGRSSPAVVNRRRAAVVSPVTTGKP